MTPSSYTIAPSDPGKVPTRIANLDAVRRTAMPYGSALCGKEGRLRVDWLELAGPEAPTARLLLDEGAIGTPGNPSRFIGLDKDKKTIDQAKALYKEHPEVLLEHVAGNFVHRLDLYPDVGVLVFDSLNKAKGKETEEHLDLLFDFAHKQARELGGFCLVLNVTLMGVSRGLGLESYKAMVAERYGSAIPGHAWHEYQSSGAKNPMLLTRLFWL
jgi:hypothetical protein